MSTKHYQNNEGVIPQTATHVVFTEYGCTREIAPSVKVIELRKLNSRTFCLKYYPSLETLVVTNSTVELCDYSRSLDTIIIRKKFSYNLMNLPNWLEVLVLPDSYEHFCDVPPKCKFYKESRFPIESQLMKDIVMEEFIKECSDKDEIIKTIESEKKLIDILTEKNEQVNKNLLKLATFSADHNGCVSVQTLIRIIVGKYSISANDTQNLQNYLIDNIKKEGNVEQDYKIYSDELRLYTTLTRTGIISTNVNSVAFTVNNIDILMTLTEKFIIDNKIPLIMHS